MAEDIFCRIIKSEIPAVKIWEDDSYLAFLDINPNTEGMTLVIPKKHVDSDVNELTEEEFCGLFLTAKKVAKMIEVGLKVRRVAIVVEGMGVNHAHIKLYPLHGLDQKFSEMWAEDKVYFENYQGYLSTQLGPQKSIEELNVTAEKIRNANKEKA